MRGIVTLLLHAHLPFVRHPEHERFLEEHWLYEAVLETYLPLLDLLESWRRDHLRVRIALTLSPTLCAMLADPLLQSRCLRFLDSRIELGAREIMRTHLEPRLHELAILNLTGFIKARECWLRWNGNLLESFNSFRKAGYLEIITCSATHAVLPLFQAQPGTLKAQLQVARDHFKSCFGSAPGALWLPECAYSAALDPALSEARFRWFVVESHGILNASPCPRFGLAAPIITPGGQAAFGRDSASAHQVWSRESGYPGDPAYRDFYRDAGFDLEFDYIEPFLPAPGIRGFTGVKYHRITGASQDKELYDPHAAQEVAARHASHFFESRRAQVRSEARRIGRPPIILCPYDAELFGHWWHEGMVFLDRVIRLAHADPLDFILDTPSGYLSRHSAHQAGTPASSSWGDKGYWKVWLNESNHWIYTGLARAAEKMSSLARDFSTADSLTQRALDQASRELLLAQSSDWPFMMRAGAHVEYARGRVESHLANFSQLHDQIRAGAVDPVMLARFEERTPFFKDPSAAYWA